MNRGVRECSRKPFCRTSTRRSTILGGSPRNDADAEHVVQGACVRAMRFFSSLREDDARAWLFTIVRNTWFSRVSWKAKVAEGTPLKDGQDQRPDNALDPEERLLQQHTVALVRGALEQLPADFREVIVLREIEGLSYKEIGAVVGAPIATVMSRLARARERLQAVLKLASQRGTLTARRPRGAGEARAKCALLLGSGASADASVSAVQPVQVVPSRPHMGSRSGARPLSRRRDDAVAAGVKPRWA
jgi:RNA polymerase sigma-70 factor (ECF subfamily)